MDVAEPAVDRVKAARLSLAVQMVRSATGWLDESTSLCAISAASLRSEMESVPVGCAFVTSSRCTVPGKGCRHTSGGDSAPNHTPPIPCWQASHAPMYAGVVGTNLRKRVGRMLGSESAMARKLAGCHVPHSRRDADAMLIGVPQRVLKDGKVSNY